MQLQISRDVIEDAHRFRNVRIVRRSHRVEAHAAEAIARIVNRQTILQGERERTAKTLDQVRQRRALFAHLDEDFAWSAVLKQADRQISLMSSDDELMREGPPRCGQHSAWIDGKHGL